MSLSRRAWENLPPFFFSPRFANTLNHNQFVLGMLGDLVNPGSIPQDSVSTYFFSLMEFPSQFSTFVRSLVDIESQISGATANAKPMWRCQYQSHHRAITEPTVLTQRTHLHHSLIIIPRKTPVLRIIGVRPCLDTLNPPLFPAVIPLTTQQARKPP